MRVVLIPWAGGVPGFGDCRPDGRFAVNVPGVAIKSERGDIPLPDPAGLDYIRLAASLKLAGTGQSNGTVWEWDGAHWTDRGPSYGPHAVIYDAADQLRIVNTVIAYQATGGYRYVDPASHQIVSVHDSMGTAADGIREFTDCGPFIVGQGQDGGAVLKFKDDGIHRLLASGNADFVNASFDGTTAAITVVNDAAHSTALMFASVEELRALPPVVTPAPAPTPDPPPAPTPEPIPVNFPNHLDAVQRERGRYAAATLTEAQCFAVTNAVASDPAVRADGWGLTKAPAGGSGYVVNGQNYRLDKLCHPSGYINDILSDTPGAAGAQWGPNADANGNPSNWAPPVGLTPVPDPPPLPDPTPEPPPAPPVDLGPIYQQLADLKAQVAAGEARISALEDRPSGIPHGAPVTVKGHVPGLSMKTISGFDLEWKGVVD